MSRGQSPVTLHKIGVAVRDGIATVQEVLRGIRSRSAKGLPPSKEEAKFTTDALGALARLRHVYLMEEKQGGQSLPPAQVTGEYTAEELDGYRFSEGDDAEPRSGREAEAVAVGAEADETGPEGGIFTDGE